MEAIAKHDFHATAEDELSFTKGSVLKVSELGLYSVICDDNYKFNEYILEKWGYGW